MFYNEYLKSKYIIKKKRLLDKNKYLKVVERLEKKLLLIVFKIGNNEKTYELLNEEEKKMVAQKKVEIYLEFGSIYRKEFLNKFQEGIKDTNNTADILMRLYNS